MTSRTPLPRMRQLREARGWTQEDLAAESNLSAGTISAYELGTRSWTRKSLVPIAAALGVSVTDIVGKEGVFNLQTSELLEEILDRVNDAYTGTDKPEIEHLIALLKIKLSSIKR